MPRFFLSKTKQLYFLKEVRAIQLPDEMLQGLPTETLEEISRTNLNMALLERVADGTKCPIRELHLAEHFQEIEPSERAVSEVGGEEGVSYAFQEAPPVVLKNLDCGKLLEVAPERFDKLYRSDAERPQIVRNVKSGKAYERLAVTPRRTLVHQSGVVVRTPF